ncbi:HDOD domain-containing protein [Aurantivibrio plasticivorans]
MAVPSSVRNLLELQNVKYHIAEMSLQSMGLSVTAAEESNIPRRVRSVILKDTLGKVQVLFPQDCLLDLNQLNQQLARQLRASTHDDLMAFYAQHHVDSVPALPKFGGFPTVVDERLFSLDTLLLDSGVPTEFLEITQQEFQNIIGDATRQSFCIPIKSIEEPAHLDDSEQIFDAVKNFTSLRIKQRLDETLELPPLPSTAQRIIGLRVDPNADVSDLSNIVETDPSLAAQVVSWAASPYYSAPGKIKSIHDAIVRVLGFDMVLNLSLGLALGKSLNLPKDHPQGITPYWQHAVYAAATVEGLVTAIPREHRPSFGMAYLSGLLNNFGFLILGEVFPPYFELINRYLEVNPDVPTNVIERHIIGVTREQLASWLMSSWHMPEEVVVALRHQHNPNYSGEHAVFAKLLYLTNAKLRERSIGRGPVHEIPQSLYQDLHLDPDQVEITISNIMDSTEELSVIAQQLAT